MVLIPDSPPGAGWMFLYLGADPWPDFTRRLSGGVGNLEIVGAV